MWFAKCGSLLAAGLYPFFDFTMDRQGGNRTEDQQIVSDLLEAAAADRLSSLNRRTLIQGQSGNSCLANAFPTIRSSAEQPRMSGMQYRVKINQPF